MKVLRIAVTLGIVTAAMSVSGVASAGGGTWWEWGAGYAPGERVTATERIFGANSQRGDGGQAPYFAYLAPKDFWEWKPPGLPKHVLPLGKIELADPSHDAALYDATLTFDAPDVPPGEYTVIHCNDPCTHELGNLMRSPLTITATEAEARAIRYASRGDARVWRWVNHLDGRMSRQDHRHTQRLKTLRREVRDLRVELREGLAKVQKSQAREVPAKASISEALIPVTAAGLVVVLLLTVAMRKRPGGRKPDVGR